MVIDTERLEEIKRLTREQTELERKLLQAKSVADELQYRVNRLDKEITALFDGAPVKSVRTTGTELDDYLAQETTF